LAAPSVDAEMIAMLVALLADVGIKSSDLEVAVNTWRARGTGELSRKPARVLFQPSRQTGRGSRQRLQTNPLRILDSKDPDIQALASHAPILLDVLGDASKQHFEAVRSHLSALGVQSVVDTKLVRGSTTTPHHLRGEGQDRRSGRTEHAGRRRAL